MFGRETIRLGIGRHSSCIYIALFSVLCCDVIVFVVADVGLTRHILF